MTGLALVFAACAVQAEVRPLAEPDRTEVLELSKWIWGHPELSDQETNACARHVALLRRKGFDVIERFVDMPTAYRAEFSSGVGRPTFAFCSEYDALPKVGHACGHNLNGGAAISAALLVQRRLRETGADGRIVIFGCPAEETRGGKIDMVERGAAKGVDAMMMAHAVPGVNAIRDTGYAGIRNVTVTYTGVGGSPAARCAASSIRNALDAQTLLYEAVGLRRHYTSPDVAIAGTITQAGDRANTVPVETTSSYTIRSQDLNLLEETEREFRRMAEGAALLAGVKLAYESTGRYRPTNPCFELSVVYMDAMKARGIGGENIREKQANFAATDFGNFSQVVPAVHVHFPVGGSWFETAVHSKGFAELCDRPHAYENMFKCGEAMAEVALKYLTDAGFRALVGAEFARLQSTEGSPEK